jgi:hypothetical protein
MERMQNDLGLIWYTIWRFVERDWGKPQKFLGIGEIQVGICSETFQIRKMDNNQLTAALCTWCDQKVRELIAVKVLHTSLLNITVIAFKVLPFWSHALMPVTSPPLRTIWNWFCGTAFRATVVLLHYSWCHQCHQCHQNSSLSIFPLSSGTENVTGG